jgi:hypothetical protein
VRREFVESFGRRVRGGGANRFIGRFGRLARGLADVRAHECTRVVPDPIGFADNRAFRCG